jgi:hypothetical protein
MTIGAWAVGPVFLLLCLAAWLGRFIRPRLPAEHRQHDTVEAMILMIGMLVTFTALVLGLLTNSVKSAYDQAGHDLLEFSQQLGQLDRCLRDYGPGTEAAQDLLITYTSSVIASTWSNEAPPAVPPRNVLRGIRPVGPSPRLSDVLNDLYLSLRHLQPADAFRLGVRDDCLQKWRDMMRARTDAIEDDTSPAYGWFDLILLAWLVVIFVAFGVIAPANRLSFIGMVLCAVSLSLSLGVISWLSHPHFLSFPSTSMRDALAVMTGSP